MGAMLTMLTTGIKSGPSSEANGSNGGTVSTVGGGKSGSGVKPSAGISSKKVPKEIYNKIKKSTKMTKFSYNYQNIK